MTASTTLKQQLHNQTEHSLPTSQDGGAGNEAETDSLSLSHFKRRIMKYNK
jgi:hypothetical protein